MAAGNVHNRLKELRTQQGLSQQELARLARVTRQTIGGIEAGQYAASAHVALRLSRALGCRVEDLFWLPEEPEEIEVHVTGPAPGPREPLRVRVARVGEQYVAHSLAGDTGLRVALWSADGLVSPGDAAARSGAKVRLMTNRATVHNTFVLAGCDPALSLWAEMAEQHRPGLRMTWLPAGSQAALEALARGQVHAAGMHLYDPDSGEFNLPFVRARLHGRGAVLVNVGFWQQGLLVRPGNPLAIRAAADLARPDVRIVNRPAGTGARQLLDRELARAGIRPDQVAGYSQLVAGHLDLARAVAAGAADAGVGVPAAAGAFGLTFVPWVVERYDLVLLRSYLEDPPVAAALEELRRRPVRAQLEAVGGYDTARTGDIIAEVT